MADGPQSTHGVLNQVTLMELNNLQGEEKNHWNSNECFFLKHNHEVREVVVMRVVAEVE